MCVLIKIISEIFDCHPEFIEGLFEETHNQRFDKTQRDS